MIHIKKKIILFNLVDAAHIHLLPKQGSPIEAPMPLKQIYSDWVPLATQQVCTAGVWDCCAHKQTFVAARPYYTLCDLNKIQKMFILTTDHI